MSQHCWQEWNTTQNTLLYCIVYTIVVFLQLCSIFKFSFQPVSASPVEVILDSNIKYLMKLLGAMLQTPDLSFFWFYVIFGLWFKSFVKKNMLLFVPIPLSFFLTQNIVDKLILLPLSFVSTLVSLFTNPQFSVLCFGEFK